MFKKAFAILSTMTCLVALAVTINGDSPAAFFAALLWAVCCVSYLIRVTRSTRAFPPDPMAVPASWGPPISEKRVVPPPLPDTVRTGEAAAPKKAVANAPAPDKETKSRLALVHTDGKRLDLRNRPPRRPK